MYRSLWFIIVGLLLIGCDISSDKEKAKRTLARNELNRAYSILRDYRAAKKMLPATKADLALFNSNFPTAVDFWPDGYKEIKWAILTRSWDNKVMLADEKGGCFILVQTSGL